MRPLVTAAEMRAAEQEAATRGLAPAALMQLAGQGAAAALLESPDGVTAHYLVLAGPGNNGGDALVVAGLLHRAGAAVRIVTWRRASGAADTPAPTDPPAIGGTLDAAIPRFDTTEDGASDRLRQALLECDVLVDGLLGTGRSRPPGPDLLAVLDAINDAPSRVRVVALDLPTGIDPDTGAADPHALRAVQTLSFGYAKRGTLAYPARAHCGEIRVIEIGLPLPPAVPVAAFQPAQADVAAWLPNRIPTVQKYSAGAVLALAGSPGYTGASVLACTAAMRAGAGYVTLATTEDVAQLVGPRLLEATLVSLPNHLADGPGADALPRLREIAPRYRALLLGPGLGRAPGVTELVLAVLGGALEGPNGAVVDADALYTLSVTPDWQARVRIPIVLTPHSGEMAQLTGLTAQQIEADRFTIAATWASRWGQVLVLKGAPTVTAAPDGSLSVNPTGNALLATAGTGDVLSGVIAALLAGGASPLDAARAGVYIHGMAADLAAIGFGDRGMVAGDLLPLLPAAIRQIREG